MVKKAIFLIFLFTATLAGNSALVEGEVFHIEKGVVIKKIMIDDTIVHEVEKGIEKISGIYRGFEPIPKQGHMVKIPIEQTIEIKNEWMHDLINEVIIIIPEHEPSYLLIFNDEGTPYFFTTNYSLQKLQNYIGL